MLSNAVRKVQLLSQTSLLPKLAGVVAILVPWIAQAAVVGQSPVNVQLNLRYTHPAIEELGGTWELLAGTEGGGIAGINVLLDNINYETIVEGTTGFEIFASQQVGTVVEIVMGSNLSPPLDTDIGLGAGTTGNVVDDLFGPGISPLIWENNALLASGSFGAIRPSLLMSSGTLSAGVNVFVDSTVDSGALGELSVRGDSVQSDGLIPGDLDRSGDVSFFGDLIVGLGNVGVGSTWDEGDFNGDGQVTLFDDLIIIALGNVGLSSAPPPVQADLQLSSVPEPNSVALIIMAISLFGTTRKRLRQLRPSHTQ